MNNKIIALTLALAMGLTLTTYFGVMEYVFLSDTYFLSTILAVFAVCAYGIGLKDPSNSGRFAEVSVGLGLLGTIIGFSLALAEVATTGDPLSALEGAFTAYHTTAVGLVSAITLRVQYWIGGGQY